MATQIPGGAPSRGGPWQWRRGGRGRAPFSYTLTQALRIRWVPHTLCLPGSREPGVGLPVNPNAREGQPHGPSLAEAAPVRLRDPGVFTLSLLFCFLIDERLICLICLVLGRKTTTVVSQIQESNNCRCRRKETIPRRVFLFRSMQVVVSVICECVALDYGFEWHPGLTSWVSDLSRNRIYPARLKGR